MEPMEHLRCEDAEMEFREMETTLHTEPQANGLRALRINQVVSKTGLSRTHTYRLIEHGDHPKPIQLSDRVFVWNEAEIDAWLASKFTGEI
jgi:predicted DNA-binding transcriptional regulator AlpA